MEKLIKEYFYNGKLKRMYSVDELELKQGKSIEYFQDGLTFYETNFLNNKEHGEVIIYDKLGSIKQIGEYRHGKKHGVWIARDKDNHKTFFINGKSCEEEDLKLFSVRERLRDNKQKNE